MNFFKEFPDDEVIYTNAPGEPISNMKRQPSAYYGPYELKTNKSAMIILIWFIHKH